MTLNRQIEANRMNAKPSTGPKTAAGKERASGNALRHGLSRRRTKGDLETEHVITAMIAKLGAISLTRNQSRSADDVGRDDWNRLPNNLLHPDEKLRDAVDLIVMAPFGNARSSLMNVASQGASFGR